LTREAETRRSGDFRDHGPTDHGGPTCWTLDDIPAISTKSSGNFLAHYVLAYLGSLASSGRSDRDLSMPKTKTLYRRSRRLWRRWPLASATIALIVLFYLVAVVPQGMLIIPGLLLLALCAWFVFAAPNVCMARTRNDLRCRLNSRGIVGGCHLVPGIATIVTFLTG